MLSSSTMSIASISELLSFSSQSYFTKCFAARYDVTPKKYR